MSELLSPEDRQALLDFVHARLDDDLDHLSFSPSANGLIDPLRKLVESRPAVRHPDAFDDVERQREWSWKCLSLIWKGHPDWREEWNPTT